MRKVRRLLASILVIVLCVCSIEGFAVRAVEEPRTFTKFSAVNSASFINFNKPVTLAAGEGITMEFYVTEVSGTDDEDTYTNFGFSVGDTAAASNHYATGTKGSFMFAQKRELGVYTGKSGVDFNSFNGVGEAFAPVTSTGSWNWSTLLVAGNWVKVEYLSATAEGANDGSWKLYSKAGDEGDYQSLFTIENLPETDTPYGDVYFGITTQFAFSMTVADLSVKTTISDTDVTLSAYSAAQGTVESIVEEEGEGGEGGEVTDGPSTIPVVEAVSEISFVGIAGKNEAVNRYANITANQGEIVTMTLEVQDVDNSFMSYPNFGFAVSDTPAVGQMYAAGNAGSWIYGGKGDTTVRLYSKEHGTVASGDTPLDMTFTGAFPHDTAVVAGKTLKVEYQPATSGAQDGYWKIYSKDTADTQDYVLVASVEGLSATDAPSGSVYFGIHTYRTYKITAKVTLTAAGASYTLNEGELAQVQETFKIGDEEVISKTDVSYGEIGNANGQTAIANKTAVELPAGGTITMEGVILAADISNVPTWSNMGFSIGNAYKTAYLFSASKGSFFFGHTDRGLLIYSDKDYGQYTNFVTGKPDYETTGLTVSGTLTPANWLVPGYTIRVVYQAASSETAKDGSWTFSYRKAGEENYTVMAQVTGMNCNSAPYGDVYFGMEMTAVAQVSFGALQCYTQDSESVKLEQATGKNKLETYLALNGVAEAPRRNFEKKIFNGSYEIVDEDGVPYGWANSATGTFTSDASEKTEGALSAKLTGAVEILSEKIDVKANKYHHLVLSSKADAALTLGVNYYTADGTYVSNEEFTLDGAGEWKEYLNQLLVPENADNLKIYMKTTDGFAGSVDGVHLYQVDAEYITDRVEQSADADEAYKWLDNGIIHFGELIEANKELYFKEIQAAIQKNGGLTADVLSDCIALVNQSAQAYYGDLKFDLIKGENARQTEIKSNLELVTSVKDASVTWSSSNTSVIATDGTVTRPAYGKEPVMVTLTATVSYNESRYDKPFRLLVVPVHYDEYTVLTLNNDNFEDTSVRTLDYQVGIGTNAENELVDYDYGGYITANNAGRYGFSNAFAYAGNYAIKIASASAKSDLRSEQVFDIREHTTYVGAVMAYTESESVAPNVTVMFFDYKGIEIGNYSANYDLTQTGTWQNLVVAAHAPVGAVSVAVRVQVPGASVDAAYFDEIRLYREESVDNYEFNFGIHGWTTSGSVTAEDNQLTLDHATATSSYGVAKQGAVKVLNTDVTISSGELTATLTYYNQSKDVLSEKSQTLTKSGAITISDYAPAGTAYVTVSFKASGVAAISAVHWDTTPVGSRLYDYDFASLASGSNTAWTAEGTVDAAEEKVVVADGATLTSHYVTIQEGKKYAVVADLTTESEITNAVAKLELYNYDKQLADTYNLTLKGRRLSYTFECPLDGYYVRLVLSSSGGATTYKFADFYPVASSVSNAGFEIVDTVVSGTHPIQWNVYGDVGVYAASDEADPEEEVFNLLHMLEVVNYNNNVGGVRSAMTEDIISGRNYTASAWVKNTAGNAGLYLEYYDSNYHLLASYHTKTASSDWEKVKISGDAPIGTAYATVRIEKTGGDGALYADVVEILPTTIIVDTTQTFIDDYIIEDTENVIREFHQAELADIVMGVEEDTPWQNEGAYIYGTTLYDEEEQIYKMWYNACSDKGILDAYATSTDGIHWEKPSLLKYNFNGSTENNIIGGSDFCSVIKDYDATDPAKRYVMITFNELQYAHMIKYSPDGISWTTGPTIMKSGDVLTGAWSKYYDKYIMLAKRGRVKRDFYTITSSDTTSFTIGVDATTLATPLDAIGYQRTDCYGAGLYPLYDTWLAFDWLDKIPGTAASYGKVEIGFGFTRDTKEDWTRPYGTNTIIPDTDSQGNTWYSMYSASYPMVVNDEVWLYMGNWRAPHEVGDDECAIQIAKWRLDGFASMNFGENEGTLTTKPMIFNGNKLTLNAKVLSGGFMKVELLDKNGEVITGYSKEDCEVITSDGTKLEVKWNGSDDLSAFVGETVTMKVYGQNAEFYSFNVAGAGETVVEGENITLNDEYDYEAAFQADGYIVAPTQSTLMSGDSTSLELNVKSTASAGAAISVGIFGQENAQAMIENAETIFEEGYTVKLEYVYAEGDEAAIHVYRKRTGDDVYGEAVLTKTGLKSVMFARLALMANTDVDMKVNGIVFTVNDAKADGFIANKVTFTEIAKELEDLGPQRITSTSQGIYGYNEGINLGYGESMAFQFDVLEYNNPGVQIRLAVTDADTKANVTNAGAYKNGSAGSVMGFTATGASDSYGGTKICSKTFDTLFLSGYTYRLVYTSETTGGAGDATFILYECPTSVVGTAKERWTAVYQMVDINNTVGGNCFAPSENVKMNIFFGGTGITMSIDNAFVTATNTVQSYNNFYYAGVEVTESDAVAPEIKVSTAKTVSFTGEGVYGYNEGMDIGYGESLAIQFDVLEASVGARWSFFVTENDVTTSANGAHNYKAKATNVLGFEAANTGSIDRFGGTSYGKTGIGSTFFQTGYSYRFVYTTATDANALDGKMEIYSCPTADIGTASETWNCVMYNHDFGDTSDTTYDFHPTNNVYFGLWTNSGNITLTLDNLKVTSSEGLDGNETDLTAYGAISVETYNVEE